MPNQSFLLLEVLERILAYVQLLFISKGLWVWRVVPCIDVIPTQLNNLQTMQQPVIATDTVGMMQMAVTRWFTCMFLTLVFS